jgi:hypothetical protein
MGLQLLQQRQIAAQIVVLKPRHVAARVASTQCRNIGDVAGQEAAAERAVGDKADAELFAEWQDLGLDIAGP